MVGYDKCILFVSYQIFIILWNCVTIYGRYSDIQRTSSKLGKAILVWPFFVV